MEFISVLVRGATTSAIPMPNVTSAGSTSMNTDAGGMSVERSSSDARHGSEVAGIRDHHNMPAAISSGPMTRNGFGPIRPAAAPTRLDRTNSRMPVGRPTSAAAVAV
jgi:hypothetical protein